MSETMNWFSSACYVVVGIGAIVYVWMELRDLRIASQLEDLENQ